MKKPVVIIDNKIPYIKGVFDAVAEVRYMSGMSITADSVHDADALIVRTRTKCNESLLRNSKVKCVLTATIGYDHIDTDYCERNGIYWKNAEGCNALAVQQYVASALAFLCRKSGMKFSDLTIGIVGVGHVGSVVMDFCKVLGINFLLNDPFKEGIDHKKRYVSLEEIAEKCNVITFHTPLTCSGEYPTYHLVNKSFLSSLKRSPILINAARGEVFDTQSVIEAKRQNVCSALVIDCWEKEPEINYELLELADVATPHIAGYSADGKANATMSCIKELIKFFKFKIPVPEYPVLPQPEESVLTQKDLMQILLQAYNIETDTKLLKQNPDKFEKLRGKYVLRRDYKVYTLSDNACDELLKLGFKKNGMR